MIFFSKTWEFVVVDISEVISMTKNTSRMALQKHKSAIIVTQLMNNIYLETWNLPDSTILPALLRSW